MIKNIFCWALLLIALGTRAQLHYSTDVLGDGFESATIQQPDDYEGKVTCTLIRKLPSTSTRKAVLYVHGFNDYFFQEEMARQYNDHGYAFYAVDLRKYGRSWLPNQKFNNVRDLKEYFADIDTALAIIRAEGAAFTLLSGHSTGGLIVTYYAQQHPKSRRFQALFLNSPFFDFNAPQPTAQTPIPEISRIGEQYPDSLRKSGLSTLYGESLHQNYKGEWNYNLNWKPLIAPPVNFGWIHAIYTAQESVRHGKKIRKPVLVMRSDNTVRVSSWTDQMFTGDAVLDVADIAEGGSKLGKRTTAIVIPQGMHDLVLSRRPVREKVYQELFNWLSQSSSRYSRF